MRRSPFKDPAPGNRKRFSKRHRTAFDFVSPSVISQWNTICISCDAAANQYENSLNEAPQTSEAAGKKSYEYLGNANASVA